MTTAGILGANGFVGTRLVEWLHLRHEARIIPIVRAPRSLARLARFDLDWRLADALDTHALEQAFRGCDVVVHSVVGDPVVITGAVEPAYAAAAKAGVKRIVYLSSASVHGQDPAPGANEASLLSDRQWHPYNNAKVHAEQRFHHLAANGPVEVVSLRPGIVHGPRSRWITDFAESLLAGTACFAGRRDGLCNSIYVDNLIHAIQRAMEARISRYDVFLVGDAETLTWEDFYRPLAQALGFRIEDVPRVPAPEIKRNWKDQFESLRASEPVQALLPLIPVRWKSSAKAALHAATEAPPRSDWAPTPRPVPQATLEMAMLHRCGYKLPHLKAAEQLQYRPPVAFAEASRRNIGWLRFAGYPVAVPA